MTQPNVEIVRRAIEAWTLRDLDGALQDLHPDAEVDWSESAGVQRGVYRGIGEIRRFWKEWLDLFEQIDVRPEAFIVAGDHVVVPNRTYMRGRDGIEVDAGSTSVWKLRDGKIVWHGLFQDKDAALEAVGLSEQARLRTDRYSPAEGKKRCCRIAGLPRRCPIRQWPLRRTQEKP
jgi:ketosteroid isomerase-like protein